MIQSIASVATQMKHEMVQAEVSAGVAKMALDSARAQGDALVQLIEAQKEIYSHLGSSVNTWA